jgi:hypothetical protein
MRMPGTTTLVAIAIVALIALVGTAVVWFQKQRPVVIGQQMADAEAREAARLAAGPVGPSPLPTEQYDKERGDYSLINVTPLALDTQLSKVVRSFSGWDPGQRDEARRAISMDQQYTLIHFAQRCAVLAIREKAPRRCEDGLIALAMIEETRIDPRDVMVTVPLLSYAMTTTKAERKLLVDRAKLLATPQIAEAIASAMSPGKLSDTMYTEIQTENGFGLVAVGLVRARYEPTFDMGALAIRIASQLQRGRYVAEPELMAELPAIWFAKEHRQAAEALLKHARAGIIVRGTPRRDQKVERNPMPPHLMHWVVEMRSDREATQLSKYVGAGTPQDDDFVVGVAHGRLFALLVAASGFKGGKPFESKSSLALLAEETRELLQETLPLQQDAPPK